MPPVSTTISGRNVPSSMSVMRGIKTRIGKTCYAEPSLTDGSGLASTCPSHHGGYRLRQGYQAGAPAALPPPAPHAGSG